MMRRLTTGLEDLNSFSRSYGVCKKKNLQEKIFHINILKY